jgi:hypothetical protein
MKRYWFVFALGVVIAGTCLILVICNNKNDNRPAGENLVVSQVVNKANLSNPETKKR